MNRCGSFPLLSAPHSLFSIWTNLKRSEKIPGAPTRRWGEWIWLTGPSGLHRNSPQELNISSIRVFVQIRDPEIPITLRSKKKIIVSNYFSLNWSYLHSVIKLQNGATNSFSMKNGLWSFIAVTLQMYTKLKLFQLLALILLFVEKRQNGPQTQIIW